MVPGRPCFSIAEVVHLDYFSGVVGYFSIDGVVFFVFVFLCGSSLRFCGSVYGVMCLRCAVLCCACFCMLHAWAPALCDGGL